MPFSSIAGQEDQSKSPYEVLFSFVDSSVLETQTAACMIGIDYWVSCHSGFFESGGVFKQMGSALLNVPFLKGHLVRLQSGNSRSINKPSGGPGAVIALEVSHVLNWAEFHAGSVRNKPNKNWFS